MRTFSQLQEKFASVWTLLDERTRRLMAASEARILGYGGVSQVRHACGLSRKAIAKGMREIEQGTMPPPGRVRRPGAGRKGLIAHDPRLPAALNRLIDPETVSGRAKPATCGQVKTGHFKDDARSS